MSFTKSDDGAAASDPVHGSPDQNQTGGVNGDAHEHPEKAAVKQEEEKKKNMDEGDDGNMPKPKSGSQDNESKEKMENKKADKKKDGKRGDKGKSTSKPEGGYDATPVPQHSMRTYTIKITLHRATNLPISDLSTASSDPYCLVQLNPPIASRHKADPYLRFRSITKYDTLNPEWEDEWIVAGVPKKGVTTLKIRVMDEDKSDSDDRLGDVKIELNNVGDYAWKDIKNQGFDVKKTKAGLRANLMRFCCSSADIVSGQNPNKDEKSDKLFLSVEVLGRTEKDKECGKVYTVGPVRWRQHYSPLIGRMTGTKDPVKEDQNGTQKGGQDGVREGVDANGVEVDRAQGEKKQNGNARKNSGSKGKDGENQRFE